RHWNFGKFRVAPAGKIFHFFRFEAGCLHRIVSQPVFEARRERMAHTIFILGTDPQQCKDLREILQARVADEIVTGNGADVPSMQESDTVIITSEEKNTGILYRRLLNKLEEQVHRAELLSQLIRLFSSSLQIDELLERVVSKSTEVLGDTAFIVLSGD